MTRTKKIVLVIALILVLVAAAAVKFIFFPAVQDAWFQLSTQKLRLLPAGLVIVRPTHFAKSHLKGVTETSVKGALWMLGRNATLQQLMAAANNYSATRVALPPDAPTNNFDFLVTMPSRAQEHLQLAIQKKFGWVAHPETRETDALVLKVLDTNLPGLTVSGPEEKQHVNFQNRKIIFTHMPVSVATGGLEQMLNTPVVDKTGLVDFYDYSMALDEQTQRQMRNETLTRDAANKFLGAWGLGLEPGTATIQMLVVEKIGKTGG
jgi:uncharacterized protein (TIGR03435 family)